jgi:hypothetical protein
MYFSFTEHPDRVIDRVVKLEIKDFPDCQFAMPRIEIVPTETAILEFKDPDPSQVNFVEIFIDDLFERHPGGNLLIYGGDVHHQGNLCVANLNPDRLPNIDGIVIHGDLVVTGTISNYLHPLKNRQDYGIELLVTGSINVLNLISTNATVHVHQDLTAETIYLFYDNGSSTLRIDGLLKAKALLVNDEHRLDIFNPDRCEIEHDYDLYECDYDEICEVFINEVIGEEDTKLDHDRLIQMLESGQNIFRE